MIKEIFAVSKKAKPRTLYNVLAKMMEEVGELSTEINIKMGYVTNKEAGKDGVFGECIDVAITAVDMIHIDNPEISRIEVAEKLKEKLDKWVKGENN